MHICSYKHVGGPLDGAIIDVVRGEDGRLRFDARYVPPTARIEAGSGGLALVSPTSSPTRS